MENKFKEIIVIQPDIGVDKIATALNYLKQKKNKLKVGLLLGIELEFTDDSKLYIYKSTKKMMHIRIMD